MPSTKDAPAEQAELSFSELTEQDAEAYKANATYPKPLSVRDYMGLDIIKAVTFSIESGQPIWLKGPPGIGKTATVNDVCSKHGLRLVVISAAQITVENLIVPFPADDPEYGHKVLEFLYYEEFANPTPFVVLIDDLGRGHPSVGNSLMELLQEKSLAGKFLPHLVTVIATDNEASSQVGKLATMDFAQADRVATIVLTGAGVPWRRWMASHFADTDLKGVFKVYDRQDSAVRAILSPRVLQFAITAAKEGFPLKLALPFVNGERVGLVTTSGSDVTDKVLSEIADALGLPNRDNVPGLVAKVIEFAVRTGHNVLIQGAPGIGKTAFTKAELARLEVGYNYVSAPVLQPEDLNTPFPSEDGTKLELMPNKMFVRSDRWVLVVDEVWRASRRTASALMPILQEKSQGGRPIPGLIGTIALNNPREVHGFKLDVGRSDLAAASRFTLSVEITAADIPSSTYLFDLYGEETATPFVEWWQDDLDDIGRVLCTPRCLERMIKLYLHPSGSLPLQWALPHLNGEYAGVPLIELQTRLDKQPVARLRQIVSNVDDYESQLAEGPLVHPDLHAAVYIAFAKAELSQLKKAEAECLRLLTVLDNQHRISLIRQGSSTERQHFWIDLLKRMPTPSAGGGTK
jgi:MoxR-like ATPase